jgi:hypothetical protein
MGAHLAMRCCTVASVSAPHGHLYALPCVNVSGLRKYSMHAFRLEDVAKGRANSITLSLVERLRCGALQLAHVVNDSTFVVNSASMAVAVAWNPRLVCSHRISSKRHSQNSLASRGALDVNILRGCLSGLLYLP